MKKVKILGLTAVVGLSMVVMAACGSTPTPTPAPAPAPGPGKTVPANIDALLTKGTCVACHKVLDKGAVTIGTDLSNIGSKRTAEDIVGIINKPSDAQWGLTKGAQMLPATTLSDDDKKQIAEFLATLK